MKTIRHILLRTLGFKGYLSFVSWVYIRLVSFGFLKSKYPELFFLKKIIKPGFVCIDIGANMGYYSYFLAKYAKQEGQLYAVEPVPLFAKIWEKNVPNRFCKTINLFPFALGGENKEVKMGVPVVQGIVHHGMTHIINSDEQNLAETFSAPMRIPDELFANLPRVDFVKCDVEGYEQYVFENMKETIMKHRPLVQSELGGEQNRKTVICFFENLGYKTCILTNNELVLATPNEKMKSHNDFYFVPNR